MHILTCKAWKNATLYLLYLALMVLKPYRISDKTKKPRVDVVEERDEATWSVIWSSVGLFFWKDQTPLCFTLLNCT